MDSIIPGLVGGLTAQLVRVIWDNTGQRVLTERYAERSAKARTSAAENIRDFVNRLGARVQRLETQSSLLGRGALEIVDEALSDPDVVLTLDAGTRAAARTSDPGRHETIARLVAERLTAAPESEKAAAVRQAVDIIHQLSAGGLARLGLLALIYAVRPRDLALPADHQSAKLTNEEEFRRWDAERTRLAIRYGDWFQSQMLQHEPLPETSELALQELVAAGCITVDRLTERRLHRILSLGPDQLKYATPSLRVREPSSHSGIQNEPLLVTLWDKHLRYARLTPPGLVIGLSVHDAKTGGESAAEWQWSPLQDLPDDVDIVPSVRRLADGSELERRAVEAVRRQIQRERAARGDARVDV